MAFENLFKNTSSEMLTPGPWSKAGGAQEETKIFRGWSDRQLTLHTAW